MVSSVSFGQSTRYGVNDSAAGVKNQPQSFTRPEAQPAAAKPKKKHTALKVIAGLVAAAAIVAGGLAAGAKTGKLADWAGKIEKDNFLKKGLEGANKWGESIARFAEDSWKSITGFFSKKGAKATEEVAEAAK